MEPVSRSVSDGIVVRVVESAEHGDIVVIDFTIEGGIAVSGEADEDIGGEDGLAGEGGEREEEFGVEGIGDGEVFGAVLSEGGSGGGGGDSCCAIPLGVGGAAGECVATGENDGAAE